MGRRELAVADHVPDLFDALVQLLQSATPRSIDPTAPFEDAAIRAAAEAHAIARTRQGLRPTDVLVEFRLLRQELGHGLRDAVPDGAPTGDVVAAELVLNDALDGAIALALSALTTNLEQQREEFLATTVHEVGQPLTTIRGCAQLADRLLSQPSPDTDRVRENIGHLLQATDRMSSLLTRLTDSSRTALGGLNLEIGPVDLAAVIADVVQQLSADIQSRITVQIDPCVSTRGRWDGTVLTHLLSNLVGNAVKYSGPGTPITIAVGGNSAEILLSVKDHGIGIPAEDLSRVFDRYGRAENAMDAKIDGLGLGLYLCRGIAEAHGGRIWAMSPGQGEGTTVWVSLPRDAGEDNAA